MGDALSCSNEGEEVGVSLLEPAPTIATPRLLLRQLQLSDAETLHPMLADPDTMKWWSSGPHQTVEETRAYLGWNASLDAGHRCWAITHKGGPALGWVIIIVKRPGVGELGYILARERWGQGVAREAVEAIINHAFRERCLRRLFADTDPDNAASIALLKTLGFQQEGHLRGEWETHVGVRDSLIFGLLAAEWPACLT